METEQYSRRELFSRTAESLGISASITLLAGTLANQGCAGILKDTEAAVRFQTGKPEDIYTLLEEGKITPAQLFKSILENPDFQSSKPPIISENPDAPIFIILEDIHGSPAWEKKNLEYLRSKYGINFVAIEGWAGHKVDEKRGHQILNGEEELIKDLLSDSRYKVLGLENEQLQERDLKALTANSILQAYELSRYRIRDQINTLEEELEFILYAFEIFTRFYPEFKQELEQDFVQKFKNAKSADIENLYRKCKTFYRKPEFQTFLKEGFGILGISTEELTKNPDEKREELEKRLEFHSTLLDKTLQNRLQTDKTAIEILSLELAKTPSKVTVIVFGRLHSPGLMEELQKRGGCSILAIK